MLAIYHLCLIKNRKHTVFEESFTGVHIWRQVLRKFFYSSILLTLTRL